MSYHAIILGGSFAGIAAGLQLARARRRILLIDAGQPRNRFAATSHGIFGHDGKTPADLRTEALAQLLAYPSVTFLAGWAVAASGAIGDFTVTLDDGQQVRGARLLIATGVRDILPPIVGMAGHWGSGVLHCPYCHGYELNQGPIGVVAVHPLAIHQALLLPDWGKVTYFTQGIHEPDPAEAAKLAARAVTVERTLVVALRGTAPVLDGVELADGRFIPLAGIFTQSRLEPASTIAGDLGCGFTDGPLGPYLTVDDSRQTSIPGVYAAGDAATGWQNGTLAMAAGVMAGVGVHRSLIEAEMGAAW